jgi:hypothetical protein
MVMNKINDHLLTQNLINLKFSIAVDLYDYSPFKDTNRDNLAISFPMGGALYQINQLIFSELSLKRNNLSEEL